MYIIETFIISLTNANRFHRAVWFHCQACSTINSYASRSRWVLEAFPVSIANQLFCFLACPSPHLTFILNDSVSPSAHCHLCELSHGLNFFVFASYSQTNQASCYFKRGYSRPAPHLNFVGEHLPRKKRGLAAKRLEGFGAAGLPVLG